MTKPVKVPLCVRCKGPKGYRNRGGGLCKSCHALCPVCEERPKSRGVKRRGVYCLPCANALQQAALCAPGARAAENERLRKRHRAGPAREMLRAARARAKRSGLPFQLSVTDVHVPECCPVLGVLLEVGTRTSKESAFSLDRIVPSLGYVKDNVRVISNRANTLKRDASIQELEAVLAYMKGLL